MLTDERRYWRLIESAAIGFRKFSSHTIKMNRKSLHSRGSAREMSVERHGCWHLPRRRKLKLWAMHPFQKGMEIPTGMAPPRCAIWHGKEPHHLSPTHTVCHELRLCLRDSYTAYVRVEEAPALPGMGRVSLEIKHTYSKETLKGNTGEFPPALYQLR